MVFKVYYQPSIKVTPRRENTESLYLEADSEVEARKMVETMKDSNIEFIQPLDDKALSYEKQSPDFKITEFDAE